MQAVSENRRILVIDDNEAIHADFKKIIGARHAAVGEYERAAAELFGDPLESDDDQPAYEMDSAFQGREGLELVEKSVQQGQPFALAFVDVRMPPGWDGIETIERIWRVDPDVQIVVCTAHSDYSWETIVQRLGHTDRFLILKKPFDMMEVRQLASGLVTKWNQARQARLTLGKLHEMVTEQTGDLQNSNEQLELEIDERRRSEAALRATEAKIRAILDTAADGIITMDCQGIVQSVNQAAELMFGCAASQIVGHAFHSLFAPGADQAVLRTIGIDSSNASNVQPQKRFEASGLRADGLQFPLDIALARVSVGDDSIITAILRDLSEQKHLEAQVIQSQKLESIGQLAAGIAHEINTPTQYVGDNIQFVKSGFDDLNKVLAIYETTFELAKNNRLHPAQVAEAKSMVEHIELPYLLDEIPKAIEQSQEGINRVATIVRAMKEFSHPGTEGKALVDLNRSIESTLTVARNEWKDVAELVTDFDITLPEVRCLPAELNQVVLNLVVNAAHAIEEAKRGTGQLGRLTVSTRKDGDAVEIRVQDNGCGVSPEHLSRIYDPFFTTKPVGKGTGQGLAIARTIIVQKHGGTIRCESQKGIGTTFILRLPLAEN